jgi:hypothetical protein
MCLRNVSFAVSSVNHDCDIAAIRNRPISTVFLMTITFSAVRRSEGIILKSYPPSILVDFFILIRVCDFFQRSLATSDRTERDFLHGLLISDTFLPPLLICDRHTTFSNSKSNDSAQSDFTGGIRSSSGLANPYEPPAKVSQNGCSCPDTGLPLAATDTWYKT